MVRHRTMESPEDLENLRKDLLNKSKSNFFSIIDKYICLSHGLPSPTQPSAAKRPVNRERSHSKIVSRDSTDDFLGFPNELEEEVEETLRNRKLELGLPEDFPLQELNLSMAEDKEIHETSTNDESAISDKDDSDNYIIEIQSQRDAPLQNKENQSLTREFSSTESDCDAMVNPVEEHLSTESQCRECNLCCFTGRLNDKAQIEQHTSTGNASLKVKTRHTHLCLLDTYDLVAVTVLSDASRKKEEKSHFPSNALCIFDLTNTQSKSDSKSSRESSTNKQNPSDQNISARGDAQRVDNTEVSYVNSSRKSRRIQDNLAHQLQTNDTERDQRRGKRREISHSKNDVSKGTDSMSSIVQENMRNKKQISLNDSVLMNPVEKNDICNSVVDVCSATQSQDAVKNGETDRQKPFIINDGLNELPKKYSKGDKQKSRQQDQVPDAIKADQVNIVYIQQNTDNIKNPAIPSLSTIPPPSELLESPNSCLHNPEQSQNCKNKETSERLIKVSQISQTNKRRIRLSKTGTQTEQCLDGKRRNEKKKKNGTQVTKKYILQKQRNIKRQISRTDSELLHDSVCMNADDDDEIQSSLCILPTARSVTGNKEGTKNDNYNLKKDSNGNICISSSDSSEHSWQSKRQAREGRKVTYKDRRSVKTILSHHSKGEETSSNKEDSNLPTKVLPEGQISGEKKSSSGKVTKNSNAFTAVATADHPAKRKRLVIDYKALYDSVPMNTSYDESYSRSEKKVASGDKTFVSGIEKQLPRIFANHSNNDASLYSNNLTDQKRQSHEDNVLNRKESDGKKRRIEQEIIQVCNNARNPSSGLTDSDKHTGHAISCTVLKVGQISSPACAQEDTSYSLRKKCTDTFESSKFNPHSDDSNDSFASLNPIAEETTAMRSYHNSFTNMRKHWQKSLQISRNSQERLDKVCHQSESVVDSGINSTAKKWTSSVSFWDLSDEDVSQRHECTQSVFTDSSKTLAVKQKTKPLLHKKYLTKPRLKLWSQPFKINGRIVDPARYF